jgi:hypothetical protein
MADMLEMPAGQLRHPMALFVPVKTGDRLFHRVLYSNDVFFARRIEKVYSRMRSE